MNISKYEKQGFEGIDVDLETSLLEYGLIWKEYKYNLKKRGVKKGETLAVHCDYNGHIDWGYFTKDDIVNLDWIDWEAVSDFTGLPIKDLKSNPTGLLLFDLINYYGPQEFGLN